MKARRRLQLTAGAVLVAASFAACGPLQSGAAVVYSEGRITDNELAAQVNELASVLSVTPTPELTRVTLQRLTSNELIEQAADQLGVTVSRAEVELFTLELLAAYPSAAEFELAVLQQGVTPSQLEEQLRITMLAERIGERLMPGNTDQQVQQEVIGDYLVGVAEQQNMRVSPRFGYFDQESLRVYPPLNELSAPPQQNQLGVPGQLSVPTR